jgi:hypothetical protein
VLKLLLLTILLATFLVPAWAARIPQPRRAFLAMLGWMVAAELGYAFFLLVLYPRLAWG